MTGGSAGCMQVPEADCGHHAVRAVQLQLHCRGREEQRQDQLHAPYRQDARASKGAPASVVIVHMALCFLIVVFVSHLHHVHP